MIINQKELFSFIETIFKEYGFVKKKNCWYLTTPECICFFYLAKSSYSGLYENVLGGFLKEINTSEKDFPDYYKCDLRYAIEDMADKNLVKRAFDLENGEFKESERELLIKKLIESFAIPFLKDISTKDGIKKAMTKYDGLIYMTNADLKKYLSIMPV